MSYGLFDDHGHATLQAVGGDARMRHVWSGDHDPTRPGDLEHLAIVGEPRHAYPARELFGLGRRVGDTDQFDVRMLQRTIDVRLADCSGADDAYGHLAHQFISVAIALRVMHEWAQESVAHR